MIQHELHLPPSTRKTDPVTSLEAEKRTTDSGNRAAQCNLVLAALNIYPRHTSAELAEKMGESRYMVARRLNDLRINHKVVQCGKRKCNVNKGRALIWETL